MILALAAAVLVTNTAAFANLVGTTGTGVFTPQGGGYLPGNYFDPAFLSLNYPSVASVPPGSANISSPTVTIAAGDNIFGYHDQYNTDTADFNTSSGTLRVSDAMYGGSGALPWNMTFTDPAFTGITSVTDNFINGGLNASITGDVITLAWAGSYGPVYALNGTYTAVFNVTSSSSTAVPEPTTMIAGALLLLPFGASKLRLLRKSRAA